MSKNSKVSHQRRRASQINGAMSKGPVTESGKWRSSQNALRHGLRARVEICDIMSLSWVRQLKVDLLNALEIEPHTVDTHVAKLLNEILLASYLKRLAAEFISKLSEKSRIAPVTKAKRYRRVPITLHQMRNIIFNIIDTEEDISISQTDALLEKWFASRRLAASPAAKTRSQYYADIKALIAYEQRFRGRRDRAIKNLIKYIRA